MPTCPSCKKPVSEESEAFPFCAPRCKLLDLGNWLTGRYVVSSPLSPDELVDLENDEAATQSAAFNRPRKGDLS